MTAIRHIPRYDTALVEELAIQIYYYTGNYHEQDEEIHGKKRRGWMGPDPFSSSSGYLCEWERDEYRLMARAAIDRLVNDPAMLACLNAQPKSAG